MTLGYRSTALLIWHQKDDFHVVNKDVEQYLEQHLGNISSGVPTNDEGEAFDCLVDWMQGKREDKSFGTVLHTLTRASIHWKDPTLWIKACKAGGVDYDLTPLSLDLILGDLKAFGFEALNGLYVHAPLEVCLQV